MRAITAFAVGTALAFSAGTAFAQDGEPAAAKERPAPPPGFRVVPLAEGPWDIATETGPIHVEVLTRGLDHPWGIAFLPDGDMLVTERPGRLRLIHDGVLDPEPIAGLPDIYAPGIAGLTGIALHPDFAENRLVYLAYSKADPDEKQSSTLAVMRARWDGGHALSDVEDIFVADAWYGKMPLPPKCCGQGPAFGSYGGQIAFDKDGFLFVTSGDRNYGERVQDPSNHFGKILRLNDDGSVPADNPFVGEQGWKPEIWSTGHRNPTGLTVNPETGEIWASEFGPRGGDEVNHILRGHNYGWMDVTQGHHYDDTPAKGIKNVPGMTDPVFVWGPPSANPGNIAFYTGEAFPAWHGNLFVALMSKGLLRERFDAAGKPAGEEKLLTELEQRLRSVSMGPDGALYILTDEKAGAVLKVTPGTP